MTDSGDFLNEPFKYQNEDEIRRDERLRIAGKLEMSAQMNMQQPISLETLNLAKIYSELAKALREETWWL